MDNRNSWIHSRVVAAAMNVLLAMLAMMHSRGVFYAENWSTFAPWQSWPLLWSELRGSITFDLSAVLYVNALYLVLLLFPCHYKEQKTFHRALRWLFVITNAIAVASNLCDAVYFQYTGRRTTVSVLSEFAAEGNLAGIFATELLRHWYLLLAFAALVALLWWGFVKADHRVCPPRWRYYVVQTLALVVAAPLAIIGIRGSATAGTRTITVSNANQWVNRPVEAALVLNTPFSIIRSIGKKVFVTPDYMSKQEMEATYTPLHLHPVTDSLSRRGRNVVVLIVESMGKEYIGSMNPDLEGGRYRGYMPFIDSLAAKSMTFRYSFANGRKSMDAMPSILAGLPMMVETFFLTPASLNDIEGLPSLLKADGYSSAFFHGGHNISMGFSAFAHAIGYDRYYGLDEYCQSPKYGGMDDFDGKWAIWDEPFLQFMLDELEHQPQPFVASAFTASSHHPYDVPEQYADSLRDEGGREIHKCVRYTDLALRRFFERAEQQPWYRNTLFVLVADHTNQVSHDIYQTDLGLYSVPIILFTPDGTLPAGERTDVVAQQTDITPTILHLLGCQRPYLAFGSDLLATPPEQTWAFNYNNGIYQLVRGSLLLQWNGERTVALYDYRSDPLLHHNLFGTRQAEQNAMECQIKAVIQQYMWRMNDNVLTPARSK